MHFWLAAQARRYTVMSDIIALLPSLCSLLISLIALGITIRRHCKNDDRLFGAHEQELKNLAERVKRLEDWT